MRKYIFAIIPMIFVLMLSGCFFEAEIHDDGPYVEDHVVVVDDRPTVTYEEPVEYVVVKEDPVDETVVVDDGYDYIDCDLDFDPDYCLD